MRYVTQPIGGGFARPPRPGKIENTVLQHTSYFDKSAGYSRWGAKLKKNLDSSEFVLISEMSWNLLVFWYDGGPSFPRPVNAQTGEVEFHPLSLKIMKPAAKATGPPPPMTPNADRPSTVFACFLEFSRSQTVKELIATLCAHPAVAKVKVPTDSLRVWDFTNQTAPRLLDDESKTGAELCFAENTPILAEIRNADLTWPSEMFAIATAKVWENRFFGSF